MTIQKLKYLLQELKEISILPVGVANLQPMLHVAFSLIYFKLYLLLVLLLLLLFKRIYFTLFN